MDPRATPDGCGKFLPHWDSISGPWGSLYRLYHPVPRWVYRGFNMSLKLSTFIFGQIQGIFSRVWGSRPNQTINYRLNYKALYPRGLETSLGHSNVLQSSLPFAVNTQQTSHASIWRWIFQGNFSILTTYRTEPRHSPERHNMTLHCLVDLKSTFFLVMINKLNAAFLYAYLTTHALFPWIESKQQWANTNQLFSIPALYLLLLSDYKCTSSRRAYIRLNCRK